MLFTFVSPPRLSVYFVEGQLNASRMPMSFTLPPNTIEIQLEQRKRTPLPCSDGPRLKRVEAHGTYRRVARAVSQAENPKASALTEGWVRQARRPEDAVGKKASRQEEVKASRTVSDRPWSETAFSPARRTEAAGAMCL